MGVVRDGGDAGKASPVASSNISERKGQVQVGDLFSFSSYPEILDWGLLCFKKIVI